MIRLIKHIFRRTIREQLPRLENSYTTRYDPASISEDEHLILLAGVAKDPAEARRIMAEYGAPNAVELLKLLPKHKIDWRGRVKRWLLSLEGSYQTDPYKDVLWPPGHSDNRLK